MNTQMNNPTSGATIETKVAGLRDYFASGATHSLSWRKQQLNSLKKLLKNEEGELLAALQADLGKCDYEGWVTEVGFVRAELQHSLKKLASWMKPRRVKTPLVVQPAKSFLLPEALGTVLIIGAWNYPIQLVLAPLVAAISAGNCALLKPSELSPNTSRCLAELLPKYLDPEAVGVV